MKGKMTIGLGMIVLGVLFFGTPIKAATANHEATLEKLEIFAKALNYIETNYVHEVDMDRLIEGAIGGMLQSLDPHTQYMAPERFQRMKVNATGKYGGVGLEIVMDKEGITVVTPIEGSPAFRAGIKPGDIVLEIDNQSTKGMSLAEAQNKLRGEQGKITILLQEKATGITRLIELARETIKLQSVKTVVINNIAYSKISAFQNKTTQELKKQLLPLIKSKTNPIQGLVLDLRNNPGGLLEEAVKLADLFLEDGIIVSTKGRRPEYIENRRATSTGTLPPIPMVLLINGGTASAPEIVAGALQDHGKAVIMGMRSFGKGSVQTIIGLEDGSGLKITVATYYTPKGVAIQARGIVPDIVVNPDQPEAFLVTSEQTVREEDLKNHLEHEKGSMRQKSKSDPMFQDDIQLQRALDHLQAWITFSKSKPLPKKQAAQPKP